MRKFWGQGSNLHHSSDLKHCSDNARSLARWATRELLWILIWLSLCLECLSFGQLGLFPPILENPVPNHFNLLSLAWKLLFLSLFPWMFYHSVLADFPWACMLQVLRKHSLNKLKWSTVGRMKKVLGESTIGWRNTLGRWLSAKWPHLHCTPLA